MSHKLIFFRQLKMNQFLPSPALENGILTLLAQRQTCTPSQCFVLTNTTKMCHIILDTETLLRDRIKVVDF